VVASSLRCAPVIAVKVGAVVSSTTARVGKGTRASAIALPKSRRFGEPGRNVIDWDLIERHYDDLMNGHGSGAGSLRR